MGTDLRLECNFRSPQTSLCRFSSRPCELRCMPLYGMFIFSPCAGTWSFCTAFACLVSMAVSCSLLVTSGTTTHLAIALSVHRHLMTLEMGTSSVALMLARLISTKDTKVFQVGIHPVSSVTQRYSCPETVRHQYEPQLAWNYFCLELDSLMYSELFQTRSSSERRCYSGVFAHGSHSQPVIYS